jgi:hypothetical protein
MASSSIRGLRIAQHAAPDAPAPDAAARLVRRRADGRARAPEADHHLSRAAAATNGRLRARCASFGVHPGVDDGANHAIEPTGSCVDPALTGSTKDPRSRDAVEAAKLDRSFGQVRLPEVLGDSVLKSDEVLVRFVADTNERSSPSVSVLDSPSARSRRSVRP